LIFCGELKAAAQRIKKPASNEAGFAF